jgi:hypothetical protein
MQTPKISRLFPAICAVIFCSSLMLVRADDTPAQAAARAALMEKLNEPVPPPTSPPPVVVAAPAPNEPIVEPAPAPVVVAAPVADSEAQARAALLQKNSEAGEQPAAPPEKVLLEKIQTPPEAAPIVNEIKSPETNSVAPVIMENEPAVVVQPVVKPIQTPALPISATKEERLRALLEKYKADQITPAEYHTERAKIIGEP